MAENNQSVAELKRKKESVCMKELEAVLKKHNCRLDPVLAYADGKWTATIGIRSNE